MNYNYFNDYEGRYDPVEVTKQQGNERRRPNGPGMTPSRPSMPPGGPGMTPSRPSMPPGSPGMTPSRPSMPPSGPGMTPSRPSMPPGGPGMTPSVPSMPPSRPGFPPSGPGMPPSGPGLPPGGPGLPPSGPGLPSGEQFAAPRSAPPAFEPITPARAVNPRDIRRCINRFTFIWLRNGNSFWFFPVFVSRDFVLGFRWGRRGWEFTEINLRRIMFFQCY